MASSGYPLPSRPESSISPVRVAIVLAVVFVFCALLVFDTAALVGLAVDCATGGCGVPPVWIATAAVGLGLAVLLSARRHRGTAKTVPARKPGPFHAAPGKPAPRRKPTRAKTPRAKP
jgi:hypothetical protein